MLRGRREQTEGHSEAAPSLPFPTPNLSWQVHMRTTPALHELAASGWCPLGTVVQQGLRQMCVQVLPLLLAPDTSIDLLRYQGQATAQPLRQPSKIPLAQGKSAATITRADGRADSWTPAAGTIKKKKGTVGSGTQKGTWPELVGKTIPVHQSGNTHKCPSAPSGCFVTHEDGKEVFVASLQQRELDKELRVFSSFSRVQQQNPVHAQLGVQVLAGAPGMEQGWQCLVRNTEIPLPSSNQRAYSPK